MSNLEKLISEQAKISKQLDIPAEDRANLLKQVNDFTEDFIEKLPTAKSYSNAQVNHELLKIDNSPTGISNILKVFKNEVTDKGLNAASGGHIGYIPGGGIYASSLGDYMAAISNVYAGVTFASPGAVAIENEVLNWLKEVFGFPKNSAGNLASGGSISNLIALTAARDKFGVKNEKITKSVVYLSSQVHHCINKALKIIGLEDVIVRHIPLNKGFRINPEELEKQIQKDKNSGLSPFLVIASAGTTDTGAVDLLDKIADISQKNNLWFHVDAAYGGFFIMSSKRELFKGIEKADSLVVDPHKGMFIPYGVGAVLIKDYKSVLKSNNYSANYMQDAVNSDLAAEPANVSPELTKHFRGLRVWLPLKLHGIEPFKACLEEKLLLTKYFRQKLSKIGFKLGPEPDLSVSYFWYPSGENENEFNQNLMKEIHKDGRVFLSSTNIDGKFVIRMAILSFRTTKDTIDRAVGMIGDCTQKLLSI